MRSFIAAAALVGAAFASPIEIERRAVCAPQATGTGPATAPDTASAFAANPVYGAIASGAPVPGGFTRVFQNLNASNNANGYMGYTTLPSYDTNLCAQKCSAITGCESFNIYFERDPVVDPNDQSCANPNSTVNIKCVFWGGVVSADNANNYGQWRSQFQVLVAGSNGYVNNSFVPTPGYNPPTYLGNASINALSDCNGANTYMQVQIFPADQPFDPRLCANACTQTSNYAIAHPPTNGAAPMTCQFFNTYIQLKNGISEGQFCAMYNETWPASTATNYGQWRGQDQYTIQYSYTYSNSTNPGVCTKV